MIKLNAEKLNEVLTATANENIRQNKIMGIGLRVCQHGQEFFSRAIGVSDAEKKTPLREDAIYRMASMTKPVTAVAVLILAQEGKLNLFDPAAKYVPDVAKMTVGTMDENKMPVAGRLPEEPVRLYHLLTHTSGFGSGEVNEKAMNSIRPDQMIDLAHAVDYEVHNTVLEFEPFTDTLYSPVAGFDLLARIVEIVSGQDYDTFCRKRIFEPLGMTDTGFTLTEEQWSRMVMMHKRSEDGTRSENCPPVRAVFGNFPLTYYAGGAGLCSTLTDYSRFAEMLSRDGELDGARILSPTSVAVMRMPLAPHNLPRGAWVQTWGLGTRVITSDNWCPLCRHTFGWSGAYGTHYWVDPYNHITAVMMRNSAYDGGAGARMACEFEADVMKCTAQV